MCLLLRIFSLMIFSGVLNSGCAGGRHVSESTVVRQKPLSGKDAALFYAHISDRIAREYVEPVENSKLLEGALNGMLQALDPHSAYLDERRFQEIQKQTHGEYGGLGMEITMDEGVVRVVSPIEDTPAFKAGIKTNDHIIMINDDPVHGLSIVEASEKMKGEPGTEVKLIIRRGDMAPFEVILTREKIRVHPVKSRIEGNIGYVRITTFNEHTTKELRAAIHQIRKKLGEKLVGVLVDVRNNAGGLLDQAVETTDLFLESGEIVSIRGRDPAKDFVFKANKGDILNGLPMVVLINGGSASASEILAGALQDHSRAVIVGTRSFGKGSVQTVIPMTNGGAIKLTTARYFTPSGRSIQKTGINPDILIEQHVDLKSVNEEKRYREANLQKALEQGKNLKEKNESLVTGKTSANSRNQVAPAKRAPGVSVPMEEDKKKADSDELLKDVEDYQMIQALNILKAISLQQKKPGRKR